MKPLDKNATIHWTGFNGVWTPVTINTNCPHCGLRVAFSMSGHYLDKTRDTNASTSKCPSCMETIHVWTIKPLPNTQNQKKCELITIYPYAIIHREPINGIEAMPEKLKRAYLDTIDVFNAKVWSATATCCRRTLEGVVNSLLGDIKPKGTLAENIAEISHNIDLSKPLITLSNEVRHGGNLGAHFDLEKEPNREIAEAMLDLLEYLLEYVFTLPSMIEELKGKINSIKE